MRVHELIRKGSDMFHLYDFLIYCFITAYTPGANNLLAMSNAIRLGFRRSLRSLFGIVAAFTAVMLRRPGDRRRKGNRLPLGYGAPVRES